MEISGICECLFLMRHILAGYRKRTECYEVVLSRKMIMAGDEDMDDFDAMVTGTAGRVAKPNMELSVHLYYDQERRTASIN